MYQYTGPDLKTFPNQLYINPDECIDCGECEPKCPWQAIYPERDIPELFRDDISLNAATSTICGQFKVKAYEKKEIPTLQAIANNHSKWRAFGSN